MTTVFYAGSFDPVHFGHLDVIARAARLFDRIVVGVGAHHAKAGAFSATERVEMIRNATQPIAVASGAAIDVVTFDGLVVTAAAAAGARAIVKGLRTGGDLDYEEQMAGMNRALAPEIDTIYVGAAPAVRHIASSLVKQIAGLGGDVTAFVPPHVAERLRARRPA